MTTLKHMWQFAIGFVAGAYVYKHYDWPDVDYYIETIKNLEEKKRKK